MNCTWCHEPIRLVAECACGRSPADAALAAERKRTARRCAEIADRACADEFGFPQGLPGDAILREFGLGAAKEGR